jgi:hypothetical protein
MPAPKSVTKEGKVSFKNRKFYVTVGRAQKVVPTGALVSATDLRKLVGQTVPITTVGKSIVAIGKFPGVLCYVPADPFLHDLVQPALQRLLQDKFVQAGILRAG